MKNDLNFFYRLREEYREIYRQTEVGYLLYKNMFPVYLNSSAIDILELCDGSVSVNEIIYKLSNKNKIPYQQMKENTIPFLRWCVQNKIVVQCEEKIHDIDINVYGSKNIWIPYALCIELTQRCPLRCIHCYVRAGQGEMMKENLLDSLVESIIRLHVPCVQLTGGEPLLHPKFTDVLEKIAKNNIRVTITTSGYYSTDYIIDSLKIIREINSYIQVSIDGISDVHNKIRGREDAFNKSMRFIKKLLKNNILVVVASCWINQTYEEMENLCFFLKQEGIKTIRISIVDSAGRAKDNCISLKLLDIKTRIEKIKKLQNQFNDNNFNIILEECDISDKSIFKNCGLGYNMYKIDPQGNIYECLFSSEIIGMLTKTYKLEDYLEDNKEAIQKRTALIAPNKSNCGQCENFIICNGCLKKAACKEYLS